MTQSTLTPEAIADALTEMRSWPALPGGSTETACAALEAIGRVRELHAPYTFTKSVFHYKAGSTYCPHCDRYPWPCPTVRAIDGEGQ